jgi:TM2 domain-containing membrane protein YozV
MEKARKAAMFSAFLLPGWGQIYLGHIVRGLAFIISSLAGSLVLAWVIIRAGIDIIRAAPFKKGTVQPGNVLDVTLDALKTVNINFLLLMISLIILLWVLSIIDAYQLGKKHDLTPASHAGQPVTSGRE